MSKSKTPSRKLGRKNRARRVLVEQLAAKLRYVERCNEALESSNCALRVAQRDCIRIEAVQRRDYPRSVMVIEVSAFAPAGNRAPQKIVRRIDQDALRLKQSPDLFLMDQRKAAMQELLLSLETWPQWRIDHKI